MEFIGLNTKGVQEQMIVPLSDETSDLEILEVTLNGMDITDFYWDWVDDAIHSQVWDYAQENRNE